MTNSNILTQYAHETMQQHTEQIPTFIFEQLQIVMRASKEVELLTRTQFKLKIRHQKLTDQKKELLKKIYSNLRIPFAIVQAEGAEVKKRYFFDAPSSIFRSSGEQMLELLEKINTRIEDDPDSPLIAYKEQLQSDFEELKTILTACYDTLGSGQVATAKKQEAIKKWQKEYVRLKGHLKYALLGEPLNYRIFFKDLTLTASKPETEVDLEVLEADFEGSEQGSPAVPPAQ